MEQCAAYRPAPTPAPLGLAAVLRPANPLLNPPGTPGVRFGPMRVE